MKLIKFLLGYSPMLFVGAVAAGFLSGAANTSVLAFINSALNGRDLPVRALVWRFVALCGFYVLTRIASELLLVSLGQGAVFELRVNLSRQAFAIPLRKMEEIGGHRLMTVLTDDIPAIAAAINAIPIISINVAAVIACLIYLGWLSPAALMLVMLVLLIGIVAYQVTITKAVGSLRRAREQGELLHKHFRAMTDGMKEFKLHRSRREAFLSQVLRATAASCRRFNMKGLSLYSVAASLGQVWMFLVLGLVIFALPALYAADTLTLFGYTMVILFMMSPLQVIMNTMPGLARANVSLKKMEEIGLALRSHSTEANLPFAGGRYPPWRELEVSGVTHSYHREGEDHPFTLGPVDLTLRPGEMVFITGGNGSGKTTLAKLLTGLYTPESGEIRLDGEPITDETKEHFRQHFSVIFSDFYLFESLLGLEGGDVEAQAGRYLSKLQLSHKVQIRDGSLSTVNLSQGQRKRLALLMAYLEDRPIYLFDEWAADQDPVSKEVFYHQLLPELKAAGKAVLVISHDDRYYHVADRIIKLEDGQVVSDAPLSHPAYAQAEMPVAGEKA